jgi:hypothetical protein
MSSSKMRRQVNLMRIDVYEEHIISIVRVRRIGELGTSLAVSSNRRTLRKNAIFSVVSYCYCCL